jgi:hypothetical protein
LFQVRRQGAVSYSEKEVITHGVRCHKIIATQQRNNLEKLYGSKLTPVVMPAKGRGSDFISLCL